MKISSATELELYRLAYAHAMDIYRVSKTFPAEERSVGRMLGVMIKSPAPFLVKT